MAARKTASKAPAKSARKPAAKRVEPKEPEVFADPESGTASPDGKPDANVKDGKIDSRKDPGVKVVRTGSAKPTPGSGDENDTSGVASPDKPSKKQDSGQRGKAEDEYREQQHREAYERYVKAAVEGGVTPPVYVEVKDRIDFIGQEYRDNTHDEDYDPDAGRPVFSFNQHHECELVDHIAVATNSSELVLVVNGRYYRLVPQLAAALGRLVDNGSTNLNL